MKRLRILGLLAVIILLLLAFPIARQAESYFKPITAEGKYVLLRLEDVGPGGLYGTPEGLGKLRAVLGYLEEQKIPYHITVVSRWMAYQDSTGWQEAGIDTPTPLTESFVKILKHAQDTNAVLGMHGYSHQFGSVVREDGQHNSGFANEFKVKGEPVTETKEYAASRIEKSLAAFEKNGLFPAFWESPHYHSSNEQQEVFRSYMGIIYEPNWYEVRTLKDAMYMEGENHWKKNSLGSVYVPAPLKYVAGEDKVQQLLEKLNDSESLASMYFHPFLEFNYLEAVQENGTPVLQDGIPVFRYMAGKKSPLHQLIEGIEKTKHIFGTIHDIVPFTPAHRVSLVPRQLTDHVISGDLNGDRKEDWLSADSVKGEITAVLSDLKWPRNSSTETAKSWLRSEDIKQAGVPLLVKQEKSERSDLLWITSNRAFYYRNEGDHFSASPKIIADAATLPHSDEESFDQWQWISASSAAAKASIAAAYNLSQHKAVLFQVKETGLERLSEIDLPKSLAAKSKCMLTDVNSDKYADFVAFDPDSHTIWMGKGRTDGFDKLSAFGKSSADFLAGVGDTNGDGLTDMVFYNEKNGTWQVERSTGNTFEKLPAEFGPWARQVEGKPLVGDFDGNGKADIAIYNEQTGTIDIALSYQR